MKMKKITAMSMAFNVTLSMDESAFITLVLTLQENEKLKKEKCCYINCNAWK